MSFPIDMIGKPCVVIAYSQNMPSFIGTYNEKGQCVVKLGSGYARPAEQFDIDRKPKDQGDGD